MHSQLWRVWVAVLVPGRSQGGVCIVLCVLICAGAPDLDFLWW